MSQFGNMAITSDGIELLQKAIAGSELKFSRCAVSDTVLPASEMLSMAINSISKNSQGQLVIQTVLTNKTITTGFNIKVLGLYAIDPDTSTEYLYASADAGETADYLPPYDDGEYIEQIFNLIIAPGGATNVTAIIDSSIVLVTRSDFDTHTNQKVYNAGGAHGFQTDQPGSANDGQVLKWNNTTKKHEYLGGVVTAAICPAYVVDSGSGTNFYWRKWSDGAIEIFGNVYVGQALDGATVQINFPVSLTNVNYFVQLTNFSSGGVLKAHVCGATNKTVNGFVANFDEEDRIDPVISVSYHVIGK